VKTQTLIILALVGVVVWFLVLKPKAADSSEPKEESTTGGSQVAAEGDLFGSILGTVKSIFDTVGKFASTTQKTT
jgi:preprotein translocase subunit YajC